VSVDVTTAALQAVAAIVAELEAAGIPATDDAGAFYPQPVGVLVGLPSLTGRGLASATYSVPVLVVSGDPINERRPRDRIYALADDVARALAIAAYRPSQWSGNVNLEPLPALELAAVVTVTTEVTNG
jgi:hypothetical protein